jgi:hypothetical protein
VLGEHLLERGDQVVEDLRLRARAEVHPLLIRAGGPGAVGN